MARLDNLRSTAADYEALAAEFPDNISAVEDIIEELPLQGRDEHASRICN